MKKVNKNKFNRPLNLISGSHYYDKAIETLGIEKCWPTNYSSIYKSPRVREALDEVYNFKCAFCNQTPKGSPIQVEHFRPKNGIMGENHTGYYWLGYEWTNLLLACGNCNSRKNNNFPLFPGVSRVPSPSWVGGDTFNLGHNIDTCTVLSTEKYILINPENDYPENHLYYEPDGKMNHFTGDERGRLSIIHYNLNRDELYLDGRKFILDELIRKLVKRYQSFKSKERTLNETYLSCSDLIIEELIEPIIRGSSFDHFLFTLYTYFEDYLIPRFGDRNNAAFIRILMNRLHLELSINLK